MTSITGLTSSATELFSTSGASKTAAQTSTQAEPQDTVKLSAAAQARLLHQQGQSVTVIASALGATAKQVDDYLGITLQQELEQTLQSTLKSA